MISYLSIRFGGRVVGLGNELNGLSLGGIGRETDIQYVEIMNNVDDGIEIWGGTVNLKYINVWNVGDDSFDVDQGWRGTAQFLLLVQGYSLDAAQGSGVGDNVFELDGAEDSDAQPVTTATIYNATVIGQPNGGDGGTAWRDGARVQFRNCIFMDLGEELVLADGDDGDGAQGYGFNGTLTFEEVWATSRNHSFNAGLTVNAARGAQRGDFNHPRTLYRGAQQPGNLAEIRGSIMFKNRAPDAYTEAEARGVFAKGFKNLREPPRRRPIRKITRGPRVVKGGLVMRRVTLLDPRAARKAITHRVKPAPAGLFTPARFVGAFSQHNNWLAGWTAAEEFGMTDTSNNPVDPEILIDSATGTIQFQTEVGVVYTVERSIDMIRWEPVQSVIGDGTRVSVVDPAFDPARSYRAIAQ